ncbi:MAG: hypothetical protein ABSA51_03905 [Anaerolineaceae bacterium]|jgi:hypothetical protein
MKSKNVQLAITVGAILVAVAHLIWPKLTIDSITVLLFVIAVIPWLTPLFKSIEIPGGLKFEFQDLQKALTKAENIGLISNNTQNLSRTDYSFQRISNNDPILALAGLRIEIERCLYKKAQENGFKKYYAGIEELLKFLYKEKLLSSAESSIIKDITMLLNSIVHSGAVDNESADLALAEGAKLLKGLEKKFS